MSEQRYFEDVRTGDDIPVASRTVGRTQLFLFSAATNNPHRVHYDTTWAVEEEGYADILVHGPLQAALMAQTLTDWAGPRGRLTRIALRNRASAFPDRELRFTGRVTDKHESGADALVEIEILEEDGAGQILMPGTATVALPRRTGGDR
ncbi:MaoC/PaaZ C-terminal domain-containing protein [Streptomyces albipurpureus]|uniref:Acyl dehydratase n=1 Tax=Streptomyces albipurpureus TaxID=2897419 RepID=A0ABT0UJ01_9ACTN|nr:MaoC/PaaZ C-terminal domain-containing protein [Streptomyces sp. CWNU-1]MCM2387580.1 hypothetical protein [Streptomyces sp. CWNU-1]